MKYPSYQRAYCPEIKIHLRCAIKLAAQGKYNDDTKNMQEEVFRTVWLLLTMRKLCGQ